MGPGVTRAKKDLSPLLVPFSAKSCEPDREVRRIYEISGFEARLVRGERGRRNGRGKGVGARRRD